MKYRKHFLTNTPSPGWQKADDDDVADNNGDLFVGWKDSHHWQQQLGPTCLPTPVDPDSETMPQAAKTPHKMSLLLKSNMSLWIECLPYGLNYKMPRSQMSSLKSLPSQHILFGLVKLPPGQSFETRILRPHFGAKFLR